MSFSGECDPIETTSWNEHVQRMQTVIPKLYDCSHDGRMTREGLQGGDVGGEFDDGSG